MPKRDMFTFSVVMCLYNVEEYLRDAIDSILSQTIGFRDNIQLILVNDGSKDRSGEICSEYQRKFPENIVIAERENGGLSSARNLGLTYACGKYVNFADADDLWEPDAFEKVLSFFNSHENEVDAVTCRIRYFGRSRGFLHGLDYKFRETRIIDITKEPSCLVQHVCSSFFRAESIKDLSFDASLTFGDDVDFISNVIFEKNKYGVIREAVYNYRKREDFTSLSDAYLSDPVIFLDVPRRFLLNYRDDAVRRFGKCIPYVQHMIMYDLQFRLCAPFPDGVDEKQKREYKQIILSLLQDIDDSVITKQRYIKSCEKIYALTLKHGFDVMEGARIRNNVVYCLGLPIFDLSYHLYLDEVTFHDDSITITGFHEFSLVSETLNVCMRDGYGEMYPITTHRDPAYDKIAFDGSVVRRGDAFSVTIPRNEKNAVEFFLMDGENLVTTINPSFYRYEIISLNRKATSYLRRGDLLVSFQNQKIRFFKQP